MTISKKVIAQALGHLVALVVVYVAARQGIHVSADAAAELSGLASLVVGPIAGYVASDLPPDTDAAVGRVLSVLAASNASPRSALSRVEANQE